MNPRDLAIGIMYLSQTIVGIWGNFSLLFYYLVLYCKKSSLKHVELILTHLIIANSLILLSKGVPHTMAAFGLTEFFNEAGCRFLLYVYRVGRSMSIGTTCILSVFQAITISPRNSCWKDLKVPVQRYICLSISLCWIFYLVVNFIFPVYTHIKWDLKNKTRKRDFEFCSTSSCDEFPDYLYAALLVCPEVLFSGFIIWSSSFIVAILYRHRLQVQHIHSTYYCPRISPEMKATQSILTLVSTFLAFCTLSTILNAYIALSYDSNKWLVDVTAIISMCFPTFGLFVMRQGLPVFRFCLRWKEYTNPLVLWACEMHVF